MREIALFCVFCVFCGGCADIQVARQEAVNSEIPSQVTGVRVGGFSGSFQLKKPVNIPSGAHIVKYVLQRRPKPGRKPVFFSGTSVIKRWEKTNAYEYRFKLYVDGHHRGTSEWKLIDVHEETSH